PTTACFPPLLSTHPAPSRIYLLSLHDALPIFADAARSSRKIVAADPNPRNLVEWRGLTVIKPNRTEAFLAAGILSCDPDIVPSQDRKSTRLNSSHSQNSYAVLCLKKKIIREST